MPNRWVAEDREAALETIFEMLHKVQDICEHTDFTNGKCTDCGLECGHDEVEDDYCLQCGEYQEPMTRQDYLADQAYQAHKERDL